MVLRLFHAVSSILLRLLIADAGGESQCHTRVKYYSQKQKKKKLPLFMCVRANITLSITLYLDSPIMTLRFLSNDCNIN